MKCVNCDHEQGFHIFDQGLSPCQVSTCCCTEFLEPTKIDRSLGYREACTIVQEYIARQKKCLCGHDIDKHYEQMALPIDDIGGRVKTMRCLAPGCGCEDFQ